MPLGAACATPLKRPFEEEGIVAMVRKVFDGRVAFHDGADEIAPGITVHKIGGHSKGLQSIRVKTRRGYVMLASDATHLYAHIEDGRVFPTTYNIGEVAGGLRDDQAARDFACTHHSRPRSRGARSLPAGQARPRRLGVPARRRAEAGVMVA